MKLVADEGVEGRIVTELRKAGHEVLYIAESFPAMEDQEILELCRRTDAILLTKDKDFGELVYKEKLPHLGVVLLRLAEGMPTPAKVDLVLKAFMEHGSEFKFSFSVIDHRYVRVRAAH